MAMVLGSAQFFREYPFGKLHRVRAGARAPVLVPGQKGLFWQ